MDRTRDDNDNLKYNSFKFELPCQHTIWKYKKIKGKDCKDIKGRDILLCECGGEGVMIMDKPIFLPKGAKINAKRI